MRSTIKRPPPAAIAKEISKALNAVAVGAGEEALVEALAAKTSEMLAKAAELAQLPTEEADASLPEGVAPFLRKLHEADLLGAGA